MDKLRQLLENNRRWAAETKKRDPDFFPNLSRQQQPDYLWIGCADSRVPASQIVDMPPGNIFVHRNVANLVVHTDFNFLSVLQYAVEVLQVSYIIVCGHYGCGGVEAAFDHRQLGLIDNWLRNIIDTYYLHQEDLTQLSTRQAQLDRLCELNVIEQVQNVAQTSIVQGAWRRGQKLSVHGWVYSVEDGILQELDTTISGLKMLDPAYRLQSSQ
jgi:carbonic anhydrase